MVEINENYFTEKQIYHFIVNICSQYPNLTLKIVKPRKTHYGKMQYNKHTNKFTITINNNLKDHLFLYIFLHELAHVQVVSKIKHRIKPHGLEWRYFFFDNLYLAIKENIFPPDISLKIEDVFLKKLIYSQQRDFIIFRSLCELNNIHVEYLKDLTIGDIFTLENDHTKKFKVLEKKRTRYICVNIHSQKKYIASVYLKIKKLNN